MGNTTLQLYARRKDNETYVHLGEATLADFKHHVVAYAMDRKHTNMKSLYLYQSYFRIAKAYANSKYLEITFNNQDTAKLWDESEEEISDVPWLFRKFVRKYKPVHVENSCMRVFQMT